MAHMAEVPAEVEEAFVRRTVKALAWVRRTTPFIYSLSTTSCLNFTLVSDQVDASKEDESEVSMTTVLRRLLADLRQTVTEESRQ